MDELKEIQFRDDLKPEDLYWFLDQNFLRAFVYRAKILLANGYSISVLFSESGYVYSDGYRNYEVALLKNGNLVNSRFKEEDRYTKIQSYQNWDDIMGFCKEVISTPYTEDIFEFRGNGEVLFLENIYFQGSE